MKKELEAYLEVTDLANTNFEYLTDIIQKGRIRPATFVHEIKIPVKIFKEIRDKKIINHEDKHIRDNVFFEFKHGEVVISFQHLYACEELHHLIDQYLIISKFGYYPIKRKGISKMNFDEIIVLKSDL